MAAHPAPGRASVDMSDNQSFQTLFATLGKLAAAGGVFWAVAYAAFRFLPKQWLQHKFDEQLERLRAEHASELQQARHRLDVLLRQTSKLPKGIRGARGPWEKLNKALGHVAGLVASLQSYPDLDKMEQDRFEAFVRRAPSIASIGGDC